MDDLIAALSDIIKDVNVTELSLEDAVRAKKKVQDAIKFVNSSLHKAKRTQSDLAFTESLRYTLEEAPSIYRIQASKAASQNDEYSYPQFLSPLLEVGDDKDLYKITSTGVGWSRSISVYLAMDEIAGDIEDYAEAVELARGSLNVKEGRDPNLASDYWKKKIYRGPRYYTTIQLRLASAGSRAPFWSLLNYGNKNVSMSSDIGGTPYPSRGAHRFVEKTEDAIRKLFISTFVEYKRQFLSDESLVREAIRDANELLASLRVVIDKLGQNAEFMDRIAKEIGVSVDKLDISKILIAKDRIENGDIFTTQVRVGAGKRIRTRKFIQILTDYGE